MFLYFLLIIHSLVWEFFEWFSVIRARNEEFYRLRLRHYRVQWAKCTLCDGDITCRRRRSSSLSTECHRLCSTECNLPSLLLCCVFLADENCDWRTVIIGDIDAVCTTNWAAAEIKSQSDDSRSCREEQLKNWWKKKFSQPDERDREEEKIRIESERWWLEAIYLEATRKRDIWWASCLISNLWFFFCNITSLRRRANSSLSVWASSHDGLHNRHVSGQLHSETALSRVFGALSA